MAYTTPNMGVIRPWQHSKNRYIHRQARIIIGTSGTATNVAATGVGYVDVSIPCPGRLVAVQYGQADASDANAPQAVATSGALLVKAETEVGVTIFGDSNLASGVGIVPTPVGTTSLDEGAAATAATDGFSGGFPVRKGVSLSVTSGTDAEIIAVDMWFRLCTYVKLELRSETGADGSGVATRTIRLGNAGVLSAIAIDYQNMPSTSDIVIKADTSTGPILHSRASSNTDLGPTLLGNVGADEGAAASAATDGTECGLGFKKALFVDLAQADAYTSGNEQIVMELWIDD